MADADPPSTKEHLSVDEIRHALGELTDAQMARIEKSARIFSRHPTSPDDLIQTAFERALAGTRKCPRDLPLDRFFAGVIRSIADGEANRIENTQEMVPVEEDASPESAGVTPRDPKPDVETRMVADAQYKSMQNAILDLFGDDEEAQLIILGIFSDLEGQDLCKETGLTQTEFNSKRRKIRRRVEKAMKDGKIQ